MMDVIGFVSGRQLAFHDKRSELEKTNKTCSIPVWILFSDSLRSLPLFVAHSLACVSPGFMHRRNAGVDLKCDTVSNNKTEGAIRGSVGVKERERERERITYLQQ